MANEITFEELWERLKNESPENRKMLEKAEKAADELISREVTHEPLDMAYHT